MSKTTPEPKEKMKDWEILTVDNLLGGLVLDADSELLEKNEFTRSENWVIRDKKLKRDTGYAAYLGAVRGRPRRHFSYVLHTGVIVELLVTDATVYKVASGEWQYVSDGTDTTLSGNEAAGQTTLSMTSIAGFADDDFVGIVLDDGTMHMTQINGVPGAGAIVIDVALPSAAASGNVVVKAVDLTGATTRHVTAITLPWNQWMVFTNGIDRVKRYDPATDTVEDVPGLVDTVCQTLALFDNSLVLGNMTESGTRFPFRYRYCAKGDATEWALLEAGYTDVLDSTNDIIQLLNLGPHLIAYRDKSIARISLSNTGLRRFDTITTVAGVGIFSNLGVIDLIDKHIVWGNNNFFWYRGGFSVEEIGNPVKDYVFGSAGLLTQIPTKGEAFAVLLPRSNEVLFFHHVSPPAGHQHEVLRYYLDYNKWNLRIFADSFCGFGEHITSDSTTWDELTGTWQDVVNSWIGFDASGNNFDVVLCSADDLKSHIYDYQASTDDGVAITAVFETKDFSDAMYLLRHDRLDVGVGNGLVTLEYSTNKGASWTSFGTASAGASPQSSSLFAQFIADTFRYRVTTVDPVVVTFLSLKYKYEFEW